MTILFSVLLSRERLGLSMLSAATIKYFRTIEVLLFHLPPVHLFADFYLALFDGVSLGVNDAVLCRWTEQPAYSDSPDELS